MGPSNPVHSARCLGTGWGLTKLTAGVCSAGLLQLRTEKASFMCSYIRKGCHSHAPSFEKSFLRTEWPRVHCALDTDECSHPLLNSTQATVASELEPSPSRVKWQTPVSPHGHLTVLSPHCLLVRERRATAGPQETLTEQK